MEAFLSKRAALALLTLCLMLPAAASASVDLGNISLNTLSSGLVGYWSMDGNILNWNTGTVQDMSGNGNTGQMVGMSTSTSPVPGKIGQALKFNGSTSKVALPTLGLSGSSPFTISAWIKPSSSCSSPTYRVVFDFGSNTNFAGGGMFYCEGIGSKTNFASFTGYDFSYGSPSGTVPPNVWTHVVITYSGGAIASGAELYINGIAQTLTNDQGTNSTLNMSNANYGIGYTARGGTGFFPGTIDDVRIYNRALSPQEVALLYAMGSINVAHSNVSATTGLNSGLIGYWTFDAPTINWATGVVKDQSGQGNNGQLIGMSTSTSPMPGKIGQALFFNGSAKGVVIPNNSSLNITNAITVSAWAKPNAVAAYQVVSKNTSVSGNTPYEIQFWGDGNIYSNFDVGGTFYGTTDYPYAAGKWVFITQTYDSATTLIKMYVNGILVRTTTTTGGNILTNSSALYIGSSGGNDSMKGTIDDVRIYNRALSSQEVAQLYAQGSVNADHSNTTPTVGINSGLVGYWTFDGPTINWATGIVQDMSGQGNNGQLIGMSTSTSPTPGKIGQALKFNGASQYVKYPVNSVGLGISSTGTWSGWIYPTNVGNADVNIITDYYGGIGMNLRYSSLGQEGLNAFTFYIYPSNYRINYQGITIKNNTWYFLTGVINGSTMYLYVNGLQVASQAFGSTVGNSPGVLYTGNNPTNSATQSGDVDDVRIYKRALSAQEIQQLYLMGK